MALGSSPAPEPSALCLSGLGTSVCPASGASEAPAAPSVPHGERQARVPPLKGEAEGFRGFLGCWEEVARGADVRLPSSRPLIIIMSCLPISKPGTPVMGPSASRPGPLCPCFPKTRQDATGVRWGVGYGRKKGGPVTKLEKERKIAALSRPALGCALARQRAENWEYGQVPLSEEAGRPTAGRGSLPGPPRARPSLPQPHRSGESPRATILIRWWAGEVLRQPSPLQTLAWCLQGLRSPSHGSRVPWFGV